MKRQFFLTALALIISISAVQAQKGINKVFVNQQWMLDHMGDKNLVILHVGGKKGYDEGHIEGAQLIGMRDFARSVGNLSWELHEVDTFTHNLRKFGITNKSQIVIVNGGSGHAIGFRLYFTLDYFGLGKKTRILDGGLTGWKAKNLATITAATEAEMTHEGGLKLKPNTSIKVDREYVKANSLREDINVIDARRANYYEGAEDTREHYERSGHVAGAENICWLDIVDENQFLKDSDTLKAYYEEAGVEKKQEVVAYCHVGLRASVIYTMAKALGFKARLYDGSYNEWDTLSEEYPVKTGKDSN